LIELHKGDITQIDTMAIVNAANSSLLGGGGVDGAIHRAGGSSILQECQLIRAKQGGCETGEAVITTAGNLPASYVIHTVGPVWNPEKPAEMDRLLSNCYINSLQLALSHSISTIAFPNISTGIYGFPKPRAARLAIQAVSDFLKATPSIKRVLFVCFDEENYQLYQQLMEDQNLL